MPDDVRGALTDAQAAIEEGRVTQDLLTATQTQAERVLSGRMVGAKTIRERDVTKPGRRQEAVALKEAPGYVQDIKDALAAMTQQEQGSETVGKVDNQLEMFTESVDRARTDRALGVIRSNRAKFESAPPVMKARAAIKAAADAVARSKAATQREAGKRAAKLEQKVEAAQDTVAGQRDALQTAVDNARVVARDAVAKAKEALSPKIKAIEKALADSEAALQKRYEAADAEGISDANRELITALQAEIKAARTELESTYNEANAEANNQALVAAAHQNAKVRFERRVLDRAQEKLNKLVAQKNAPRADLAAASLAAEEQRKVADRAEALAREETIKADKAKRDLEQRLLKVESPGIKGVERVVGGQRIEVKTAAQEKMQRELDAAEQNERDAFSIIDKEMFPQGKRALGPVTREESAAPSQFRAGTEESKAGAGKTGRVQKLTEARGVKSRNVPITEKEIAEANIDSLRQKVSDAREEALKATQMLSVATTAQNAEMLAQANKAEERLDARLAELEMAVEAQKTPAQRKREAKARGVFRTSTQGGATLKTEEVERLAKRVTENWKNAPEIVVVANETSLPVHIQEQMATDKKTGLVPGLYDPNTKIVYLVADNLHNANDVVMTIAHEATGHFGLREMFGSSLDATMDALYAGNPAVREQADAKMKLEPNLSKQVAVEEVLAEMAETGGTTPAEKSALRRLYDVVKAALRKLFGLATVSDAEVQQIVANARSFVLEGGVAAENIDTSSVLFRTKPKYANESMERLGRTTDKFVAKNQTWWDKIKANSTGLAFATQMVDRFAGFERLAKYMEPLKGSQMLMFLRQYDQRMHMVQQSIENGAPIRKEIVRADGRSEFIIESKEGANIKNVVTILKDAQPYVGNGEAVNRTFTMYLAALRAENKGLASLNFGEDITQAMLDEVMTAVNGNAALKKVFGQARDEYNAYNRDMIQFLASSGAISKSTATMLSASNDYIPFYREQNGVAQLLIGGESPVKLGNIADQPHLKELIGGEQPILDFMTSSVQNTNMLVDMAMRNLATKNAVFELVGLNAAKIVGKTAGPDVVRFKEDGEDRYAVIDTETIKIGNKEFNTGVPAELLVKGMEGIPTQMPVLLRAMAVPSQLLRKAITLSPMYMAKQLFRDSLAAPILSGANFTPVFGALREINSATKGTLEQRGIVGSQYMTGSSEDISQILRNITEGKPGWMKALGTLEAMGMEADALTRRAQYNSRAFLRINAARQ